MDDVKREIAIMKRLSHPHVLRLYEVMDDPKVNKLYLVLEYMRRGDLMKIQQGDSKAYSCERLGEVDTWRVTRQVALGLQYLHSQDIIHGDIKPQNLLVGDDGVVKIADFGISKMLSGGDKLVDTAGTPAFMSPELCDGKQYSGRLADVWAFGGTMFMLRFGRPPFLAPQVLQLYYKIINDPLEFPADAAPVDEGLRDMLGAMLTKDPSDRIHLEGVLSHAWLKSEPVARAGARAARTARARRPRPCTRRRARGGRRRRTTRSSSRAGHVPPVHELHGAAATRAASKRAARRREQPSGAAGALAEGDEEPDSPRPPRPRQAPAGAAKRPRARPSRPRRRRTDDERARRRSARAASSRSTRARASCRRGARSTATTRRRRQRDLRRARAVDGLRRDHGHARRAAARGARAAQQRQQPQRRGGGDAIPVAAGRARARAQDARAAARAAQPARR